MAKQTLSIVSNFQPSTLDRELADQTVRLAPLASRIKVVAGNGINCAWVNQFSGKNTYVPATDGYAVQDAELTSDEKVIATLNWSEMRQSFELTTAAQDTSASTLGGAQELRSLFTNDLLGAAAIIAEDLETALHVGTGSNRTLVGIQNAIKASGTYANINVGTYSEFAGVVSANGGTPRNFTPALLSAHLKAMRVAAGASGNLIEMHPDLLDKYYSSFDKRQFFNAVGNFDLGMDPKLMSFAGIPILENRECPAGEVNVLDLNTIEFRVVPPTFDPERSMVVWMGQAAANAGAGQAGIGIPLICERLAYTGPSDKYMVRTPLIQLVVKKPRRNGRLVDLQ